MPEIGGNAKSVFKKRKKERKVIIEMDRGSKGGGSFVRSSTVLRYTCVVQSHRGTPVLCEAIEVHLCCVKPLRYTCVV